LLATCGAACSQATAGAARRACRLRARRVDRRRRPRRCQGPWIPRSVLPRGDRLV